MNLEVGSIWIRSFVILFSREGGEDQRWSGYRCPNWGYSGLGFKV